MSIEAHVRRRVPLIGLALVMLAPLGGCTAPDPNTGIESAAGVVMRQVQPSAAVELPSVVAATRRIGVTMLTEGPADGNVVTSPSSLAVALAMLTEGARGASLAELESVLGASGEQRRDAFAALRGTLLTLDGDPAVVQSEELPENPLVHLAGQVVVDDTYEISPAYLEALADGFGAGVQRADLASADGKRVLSAWVNHHTGGLIKESAIQPDPDLKVVLQDAILLAARWQDPFEKTSTADRPFTLPDGSTVDVKTMAALKPVAYAKASGWTAVRLPYDGGQLHADLLLPPVGTDPAAVTPEVLAELSAALDAASPEPVGLTLPTLDLKPKPLNLLGTLGRIGAPSVLCGASGTDLSGIGPDALCVQQAMQQAVLKVDEEGTVAAAVTELGMVATSAGSEPAKVLHLDRPFVIQIAHAETSWPLFLAAVRDPRH